MYLVDRREMNFAVLLSCGAHRRHHGGVWTFDDAVSVPDAGEHAFAAVPTAIKLQRGGDGPAVSICIAG